MQLVVDNCKECDCGQKRPIVNKKYFLCDEKNYQRLHGGKSKQDVWSERAEQRSAGDQQDETRRGLPQRTFKEKPDIKELKKKYSIKQISDKNIYHCSDGTSVSQVVVNRKYTEAIDKIKLEREPVCQGQGRGDVPLSFSHTISRKRCKELRKSELIWDPDNLEIEGYHEPSSIPTYAHNIWETGSIHQKVKLLNFTRKLAYIKQHDPQDYQRWMVDLKHEGYDIKV